MLGIATLTFMRYKAKNPAIQHTIDTARARKDLDVLLALHSASTGYEYNTKYISQCDGKIVERDYKKMKHPNVNACINWLLNSSNIKWTGQERVEYSDDKGDILRFLDAQNIRRERKDVNEVFKRTTENDQG